MIYGNGAAVGYTPQDVRAMSLWQFQAAMTGYAKANGADDKGDAPSDDEFFKAAESLY